MKILGAKKWEHANVKMWNRRIQTCFLVIAQPNHKHIETIISIGNLPERKAQDWAKEEEGGTLSQGHLGLSLTSEAN